MKFVPILLIVAAPLFLSACGSSKSSSGGNSAGPSATDPGPAEETYCSTVTSYSGSPITITGTATYQAREHFGSPPTGGLGNPGAARPIRFAEISVKDSSGTTVQCAETLNDGTFSFQVPNNSKVLTIYVNSRANNNQVKVSVLTVPQENLQYKITTSFTADGSKSVGTINAAATGDVVGGAFNIMDQILKTNEYLRTHVGTCGFTDCPNFTVAPKVNAYWKKGYNPGVLVGTSSSLSFYLPGYSRLFILGGLNGDVDNADTDHFDNTIIIHEYGHFLEDNVFESNSPGGTHSGNKVIDPRLAWSEAWGNFIQAAVLNDPVYADTKGNIDGTTSFAIHFDIEDPENDLPTALGEGNFREFSITRLLWDAIDDTALEPYNGTLDNVKEAFADIWATLVKTTNGFNSTTLAFRNVGDFHIFQSWLETNNGGENFANLRAMERHQPDKRDYAQVLTTGGACADFSLSPVGSAYGDTGSFANSDLFRNNDFYHLKLTSSTNVNLVLTYEDTDGLNAKADVDLYLYNKSARFGNTSDMIGKSEKDPSTTVTAIETETISVSNVPAGDYLINVKVYTGRRDTNNFQIVGTPFEYNLTLNGSLLCP